MDAELPTEASLLTRCRSGDGAAFRDLHRLHFAFVYRLARRLGTPEPELDDICQEVFLVAFKKLSQFREGELVSWLYRITSNLVTGRHRRRRVREALLSLWGQSEQVETSPDEKLDAKRAEAQVGRALERLSPKKREVFVLFELEGLSGERIAELVGCSVSTVWTRLFHARKEFRAVAQQLGVAEHG